jgi:twitching motility protein PilT
MTFDELVVAAGGSGASDIHLRAGQVPLVRVNGDLQRWTRVAALTANHLEAIAERLLPPVHQERLKTKLEVDVAWQAPGVGRVRASVFRQRGTVGVSMRLIPEQIPSLERLGLPPSVIDLASESRGLVLVTGVTGSGKSTTLAALVDLINRTRPLHVLTIEDPIEFVHRDQRAVVTQREIGFDTPTYASGLRAALRQDPDVILIGEMRDRVRRLRGERPRCFPRARASRGSESGFERHRHHAQRHACRDGPRSGRRRLRAALRASEEVATGSSQCCARSGAELFEEHRGCAGASVRP